MKLAHIADVHLGFRRYHRHTAGGINQREADVAGAFRRVVDGVLQAKPDVVLIVGDFFHSVRPSNQAIIFAFQQLTRLRQALPDAPLILIAGNHDTPRSRETGEILTLFTELGVEVVAREARRLSYPELDLSILAVPHQALIGEDQPEIRPAGGERYQVLASHVEVEGTFPSDAGSPEYGGALLRSGDWDPAEWSYVALGHYHVQHKVAANAWYSGAIEYTSTNPWGELADEAERGISGKAWLLADLATGDVARRPIELSRGFLDLPAIEGSGLSAGELDRLIEDRVENLAEGLDDQVVRLVAFDVPRHVARDLDHAAIRSYKARALHFHLDVRRPKPRRAVGVGAPGTRQTLEDVVGDYLARRLLPAEIDRQEFIRVGTELVAATRAGSDEG